MKPVLSLTLLLSFLWTGRIHAQESITVAQEQFIKTRAASKVRIYTEYIELISRTKDADTRESYKQTIYLSCGKEGERTRVFNDLIPPEVLQKNITIESSIQLGSYLSKISEHYPETIKVGYINPEVSDVFYSRTDDWFFVKVTYDREIDGLFQYKDEKTPYKNTSKVDFYVNASLINGEIKMGGIYGVQPNEPNTATFTKARIVAGSKNDIVLTGKPLKLTTRIKGRHFRRGKEYTLEWEGGLADDIIQLDLIPVNTFSARKKVYGPVLNTNSIKFTPVVGDRIGTYQFRIRNNTTGRFIQTGYFKISRTIPLAAKIAAGPILVFGGIVLWRAIKNRSDNEAIEDPLVPTK